MLKKLLIRAGYLALGGGLSLIFLLIAQVNLDDVRLKAGGLWTVPDPALRVGGIYSILPGGRVAGPHCVMNSDQLGVHYTTASFPLTISNTLGASLPILASWSMYLLGTLNEELLNVVKARTPDYSGPGVDWTGHTLVMPTATQRRLKSTSTVKKVVDAVYSTDTDCEATVARLSRQGHCVTVIFTITSVAGQKIGYRPADDTKCIFPNTNVNGDVHVPRQPIRFTALLSRAKDSFGIIDYKVTEEK